MTKSEKKSDKLGKEALKWLEENCIDLLGAGERILELVRSCAKEAYESKDTSKLVTISQIAKRLGITNDYVRRNLVGLEEEGLVQRKKDSKSFRWLPTSME